MVSTCKDHMHIAILPADYKKKNYAVKNFGWCAELKDLNFLPSVQH